MPACQRQGLRLSRRTQATHTLLIIMVEQLQPMVVPRATRHLQRMVEPLATRQLRRMVDPPATRQLQRLVEPLVTHHLRRMEAMELLAMVVAVVVVVVVEALASPAMRALWRLYKPRTVLPVHRSSSSILSREGHWRDRELVLVSDRVLEQED